MFLTIDVSTLTMGQLIGSFTIVLAVIYAGYETKSKVSKLLMDLYKSKSNKEILKNTVEQNTEDIKRIEESQTALKLGMQALLKNNLKVLHKEYMERGSVESDELDNFITQYKAYHDGLGGNGTGTKYYEDVLTLKIKD